jgi:IMP dehydrogenase
MKLSDIMTRDVKCARPDEPIRAAAMAMRDNDIGALPVCEGDKIIGVITDRDIAVRVVARGEDPNRAQVRDAMTREVIFSFDDEDLEEVARKMGDKQKKRMIVLDRAKKLVGMIALADIARVARAETKAEMVAKICQPRGDSMRS